MGTKEVTMAMRDAYLKTVQTQLKEFKDEIERLRVEAKYLKPMAKYAFYHRLEGLSAKLDVVQRKLQDLSMSGVDDWDEIKAALTNAFTDLKTDVEWVEAIAQEARYNVLSWARGIAKEHLVKSIGWAEGIAEEDVITSIGWAEGYGQKRNTT